MSHILKTSPTPAHCKGRVIFGMLAGVLLLLTSCGNRTTGPIADIESDGFILTARAEGERWFDVAESRNGGTTWDVLSPERYGSTDPEDPNFGFDAPDVELVPMLEVCQEQTCWRAVEQSIERSDDAGTTWATDFTVPEGRDRFAPTDYPTVVDMTTVRYRGEMLVVAATAENGMLLGLSDGTWDARPIDHWEAPALTGSLVQIIPELGAVIIGAALAMAFLLIVATVLTRRAHEQVGQSLVLLISVVAIGPAAYYATLPLLDWADGEIVARQDAIDKAIEAATFYGAIAAVVVLLLSLLVRFRWSRRLGPLPFPDTPA